MAMKQLTGRDKQSGGSQNAGRKLPRTTYKTKDKEIYSQEESGVRKGRKFLRSTLSICTTYHKYKRKPFIYKQLPLL